MKVRFKIGESRQYPIVKWENFLAGDWTDLYLEYTKNNFNITVGRWNKKWGYSDRYSLILNDTLPPRDGIYFKYKISPVFQFDYFISSEGSYALTHNFVTRVGDSLNKGTVINRTLIGHKVELSLSSFFFYFAEVAYCASFGYLPNPKYLNPLFIYFLLQFNDSQQDHGVGVDANILWDLGLKLKLKNFEIYSDVLIDDFQYVEISTKEPPQIGGLIGIKYFGSTWNINAEYTRVWAWTYLNENPWERYEKLGYSLGHPYGPDFDEIYISLAKKITRNLKITSEFSYERKGEPGILTDWPIKPYGGDWDAFPEGSDFLWGNVEYRLKANTGIIHRMKEFSFRVKAGVLKIKNLDHRIGAKMISPIIILGIDYCKKL